MPPRQPDSGASHPRLADEVRDDDDQSDRRRAIPYDRRSIAPRSVTWRSGRARRPRPAGDPARRRRGLERGGAGAPPVEQHLRRSAAPGCGPTRGGMHRSTSGVEDDHADPAARRGSARARASSPPRRARGPSAGRPARSPSTPSGRAAATPSARGPRRTRARRAVDPRRDVPLDVAQVVTRHVLAQVGEVDARSRGTGCGSRPGAGRPAAGRPATRAAAAGAPASAWRPASTVESPRHQARPGPSKPPTRSRNGAVGTGTAARIGVSRSSGAQVLGQRLVGQHDPVPQHVAGEVAHVGRPARSPARAGRRAPAPRGRG